MKLINRYSNHQELYRKLATYRAERKTSALTTFDIQTSIENNPHTK